MVSLHKDKFTQNVADEASALYFIDTSTTTDFEISGCTFEDNTSTESTVIMNKAYGTFKYCTFKDNTATQTTQNIFMTMSNVTIEGSSFSDQTYSAADKYSLDRSTNGNFLHVAMNVYLTVSKTSFSYGVADSGGAIYASGTSTLIFNDCEFKENYANEVGGALYVSGYEDVELNDSKFIENAAG
jgi:predicted outer membrane repeat protein